MARYVVSRVSELPPGTRRLVEAGGRSIGIFNVGGELYALRNACPHQGGPLCPGTVWSSLESDGPGHYEHATGPNMVRCPWHGWEFDLATGRSWFDPRRTRVRIYATSTVTGASLKGQEELSAGPYVAETYPVSTDGEYIVLEIS